MATAIDMPIKPLASWKTWWAGSSAAQEIACSLHHTIDPTKLPGEGKVVQLKCSSKVAQEDLNDFHTSKVVEGLLSAYPSSKEPSAYLLGDACLILNGMMGNCLFGPQKANPMDEKARRTKALKEGGYLKMLLSYARSSSGRSPKGRSQTVTYLKELALSKGRPERKGKGPRSSDSTCASPASTTSTMSAETLVMGVDTAPVTPAVRSAAGVDDTDVVAQTLMLLGLEPTDSCSQEHMGRCIEDLVGAGHLKPGSLEGAFGQVVDAGSPFPEPAPEHGSSECEVVAPTNHVTQEVDPKPLQVEDISPTQEHYGESAPDVAAHGASAMPQPGQPLRRRTKGPALTRPMMSNPLEPPSEPPSEPKVDVGEDGVEHKVPDPHKQLQLVDATKKTQKAALKRAVEKAEAEAGGGEPSAKKPKGEPAASAEMLPVPEGMPEECLPVGTKRGKLSYTIYNEASGAKVEVLLKAKAFRVVKIARFDRNGFPIDIPAVKQRPWNNDINGAWLQMKKLCGWH